MIVDPPEAAVVIVICLEDEPTLDLLSDRLAAKRYDPLPATGAAEADGDSNGGRARPSRRVPSAARPAARSAAHRVARSAAHPVVPEGRLWAARDTALPSLPGADFYPLIQVIHHPTEPGSAPTVSTVVADPQANPSVDLPKAITHAAGSDSRGPLGDHLSLTGRPVAVDLACALSSFALVLSGAHPDVARRTLDGLRRSEDPR